MNSTSFKWIIVFIGIVGTLSGCSSNASLTPPATRVATQTPWIIDRVVTATPEPPTITPLPTATEARPRTPTRAATTKPVVVATKPPAATAVAVAPSATPAPACNLGTVTLREPNDGAPRHTKAVGIGGDTFRFIWDPPASLQGEGDPSVGYRLEMASKRGGFSNGATLYISNNKFLRDGKLYIFDKPGVTGLAGGDSVQVTWKVTIVKTSGGFNENDPTSQPPGLVNCGAPSPTWTIQLIVDE